MYVVFKCIDCKRSWTGLHNNSCPDVSCAGVCEIITPTTPLAVQADYNASSDSRVAEGILPAAANFYSSSQTYLQNVGNEPFKISDHTNLVEGNELSNTHATHYERPPSSLLVNYDDSEDEYLSAYSRGEDYDSYQASEKLESLQLEPNQAQHARGPNQHFYCTTTSESIHTNPTKSISFEEQVKKTTDWATVAGVGGRTHPTLDIGAGPKVADSTGNIIGGTSKGEVIGLDPVHAEAAKKKRKKKKSKHQGSSTTTTATSADNNNHNYPHGKRKTASKKEKNKAESRTQADALRFKNVYLPLPDFLLPANATSSIPSAGKAGSFADAAAAAAPNPRSVTLAHESGWTTVGAKKMVKPKLTENASSYLAGTEGGAFGTTVAQRDGHERYQKSGVHKVEWDHRKAKYSVKTVVPRL